MFILIYIKLAFMYVLVPSLFTEAIRELIGINTKFNALPLCIFYKLLHVMWFVRVTVVPCKAKLVMNPA